MKALVCVCVCGQGCLHSHHLTITGSDGDCSLSGAYTSHTWRCASLHVGCRDSGLDCPW